LHKPFCSCTQTWTVPGLFG